MNMWENVIILFNMMLIGVNFNNMIIIKNFLFFGLMFSLMFVVQFFVGFEGFGLLDFVIVGELYGGDCSFLVEKGIVFKIEFMFECFGW